MSADSTLKRPFDFVPIPYGTSVDRKRPTGHHIFKGESGRIECRLEALSPFLVMDSHNRAGSSSSEVGTFMTGQEGGYLIPGSSLKGMIRSVFEVLLPSCVSMIDSGHMIEQPFKPCTDYERLCPACRTFGFMQRGRSNARVHRGSVNVGEARTTGEVERLGNLQLIPMFGPNPGSDHYQESSSKGGRRAKGRKFYFHQSEVQTATTGNERDRGPYVAPLAPGAEFEFTVTYQNLSERELAALLASIELTRDAASAGDSAHQVHHKLGYGKPAGLGSVALQIERVRTELEPEARYTQFDASPQSLDDEALRSWVEEKKALFFESPSEPVEKLFEILRYPAPEDVTYTYYPHGRDY